MIDWEAGLLKELAVLMAQLPAGHALREDPPVAAMQRLQGHATAIQKRQPTLLYNEAQVEAVAALAHELGVPLPDSATEPFGNAPACGRRSRTRCPPSSA